MIEYNMKQGSKEWKCIREGLPTASRFGSIFSEKTGKMVAKHNDFLYKVLAEKLGYPQENTYQSAAMEYGILTEQDAVEWYEKEYGKKVKRIGFVTNDDGTLGCSPDGLVGKSRGLEIKCPSEPVHLKYLSDGVLPSKYKPQVHGSMVVTGLREWDFVSYHHGIRKLVVTVKWDTYTDEAAASLNQFVDRMNDEWKKLKLDDEIERQNSEIVF